MELDSVCDGVQEAPKYLLCQNAQSVKLTKRPDALNLNPIWRIISSTLHLALVLRPCRTMAAMPMKFAPCFLDVWHGEEGELLNGSRFFGQFGAREILVELLGSCVLTHFVVAAVSGFVVYTAHGVPKPETRNPKPQTLNPKP